MARELFPLERLMLLHLSKPSYEFGADMSDATGVFGVYTMGHKKWPAAHNCMAFIALRGLEVRGLVVWSGQSRALKHWGWHYGLWRLTDEGKALAKKLGGHP